MLYELRTYDCAPGKLPDLKRRFSEHTCGLFDKHGIRYGEFFTGVGDPDQLIYFLTWDDMAERDARFPSLLADPAWIKVRDDSERDGPITIKVTSQFYEPAGFPPTDKKTT